MLTHVQKQLREKILFDVTVPFVEKTMCTRDAVREDVLDGVSHWRGVVSILQLLR